MSRFQRMIVIPEEEYRNMIKPNTPSQQNFLEAQRQYEEQSLIRDPYSRLIHQGMTLDEMKSLKAIMRQNVARSTPKPFRGRANQLYNVMEPHINFNERGEIIDDNHQPIRESHLEDLIQYAVREHRRNIHPQGWSYFLEKMKKINVPKVSLNRETINELTQRKTSSPFKLSKAKVKKKASVKPEVDDENVIEERPPAKRLRKRAKPAAFEYY